VASSENLLRAIIGEWEGLNEAELAGVDVPYATPLVYQLDADLVPPYPAP
jgi:bisphosphoglycerate-dependent phosphoglycerate mutase